MDLDYMSSLLDEVALEGLDGITLSMLWFRLENRPNFPIAVDDESKIFIWECIAVHKEIDIFKLPKPRAFVPTYNRYEHIDEELGIALEPPEKMIDVYSVISVKDGDVRGCCATYDSRICITSEIRYDDVLLMSLNQVNEKWGDALVLVASPKARLLAIIGTEINPTVELSLEEYCLLERIGRSRYLGEVTQGEGGLLGLKASFCKQLHYYRKKLTLKGLVTKQLYYMKNKKGQATTGSLFHLSRFYTQRKTKMELLMKCLCDILKDKPQNRETCKALREEMSIKENTFKKLFYRPFQKWVKIATIPYREFRPQATLKESFTVNGQEKVVKVVQLLKHCDEGDDDDDQTDEKEQCFIPPNVHFDFSKIYHDLPLILQIYRLISEAGPEGLTSAAIGRIITLPRLDVRTVLKSLIKRDLIVTVLQERGRQKETKYIAKIFGEQNEAYFKVKESEAQLNQKYIAVQKSQKRKNEYLEGNNDSSAKRMKLNDETKKIVHKKKTQKQKSKAVNDKTEASELQKIESNVKESSNPHLYTGENPILVSLTEKIVNSNSESSCPQLTYRKIKRINMTLENLKSVGLTTLTDLQKFLVDKEKEEGYNFKIDKKSTARMVNKLCGDKRLKIFNAVLKLDNQNVEIEFICDKSVKETDSCVQLALEQIKFKMFSSAKEKPKKITKDLPADFESSEKKNDCEKKSDETSSILSLQKTLYHSQPKFLRLKTLHKFLFYLVCQHEGHPIDNSKEHVIYHNSMTWKRFVPPLSNSNRKGWCFLADVYTRMPLSIFVKIVNLRQRIKEFKEYLEDEEKSHYLITYLPKHLLNSLLDNRKYLFATDDVIKYLCYMGLITYGPQLSKHKEQVYVYIHSKAALKDTTISTPGYIHINPDLTYEKKIFHFNTLDDVENFWIELESVSFHTPLGKYSSVAGKTIAITEISHKPELLEALKHRNFDEVSDIGHIPGDGLGAGGFDSGLFLHARRNWQSSNNIKDVQKLDGRKTNVNPISIQKLLKSNEILGPDGRNRLQRLKQCLSQKNKTMKENIKKNKKEIIYKCVTNIPKSAPLVISKKKKRIKFRTVKERKKKIRAPYFDEKDKVAMEKMSKARCEWAAQEDSFLLLCKVASTFLDSSSRTLVVPYTVIRDLLHDKFPELSENKSSRACQRRVRYMMLNPTTTNNVAVFLGEAKQDADLVKEFDRVKPPKTNEKVWKEMFTSVVKRLEEKLTLPASDRCKNIMLPNNIEAFKESFEILSARNIFHRKSNHKDPESEEEVKYFALYSLVVSAMAIIPDGTEWSYLLYNLYQIYPEYVLKSVVSRLRSEKVIAVKKKTCKKDLQRSLTSNFPYRFSITYNNTLLTKFPIQIFNESKEFLDNLKCVNNTQAIELKGDIAPGFTAAVLSLVSLNELKLEVKVPDQVILFNTSLSKEVRSNIVERMIHTLSDKESVELSRILNNDKDLPLVQHENDMNMIHNLNKDIKNRTQVQDDESKNVEEDISQVNEIQRSSNASRFALYLLRQELSQPPVERVKYSQDYIVLNSCKIFCNLKSTVDAEIQSNDTILNFQKAPQLSKSVSEHRGKILTDGCISEIKASLTTFIPPEAFIPSRNFEESLEMIYDAYSPQTLSDAKYIFEEIFKANITGISEKNIWEKFRVLTGELSLFEHLHLFREAMLVIRAGVASFIYVCICYAKSWVLTSYVLPEICCKKKLLDNQKDSRYKCKKRKLNTKKSCDSSTSANASTNNLSNKTCFIDERIGDDVHFTEEVYFLPRTWRLPDGTLNKTAFIELLNTVLSHIISCPGITSLRVTERFSLILQPVQTLELLEVLEKACCIVKYYCKKREKQTLFSACCEFYIPKNPDPGDIDHLESLPDALRNLCRIQEAIM